MKATIKTNNSKDYTKIEELYEKQNKLNLEKISIDYKLRVLETQIKVEEFNLGLTNNIFKNEH